jgi:RHS repeat-associated protein
VAARYQYDEFGVPQAAEKFDPNWSGPDNLYGYTGLGYDYSSGLTYARARYYQPELGRFISEDTYEGDRRDPLTLNLYTYVGNNPLRFTDPSGHKPTVMEAAIMAQHIYGATEEDVINQKHLGDWTIIDILINEEGLKIGVYSKVKTDGSTEFALVNKGSSTGGDWINNLQQPFGKSDDMKDSISESRYFVANHKDSEITMVGHSKGGAEAVANAVANNKNAITFNPAAPVKP